jgi:hypothetical protein
MMTPELVEWSFRAEEWAKARSKDKDILLPPPSVMRLAKRDREAAFRSLDSIRKEWGL